MCQIPKKFLHHATICTIPWQLSSCPPPAITFLEFDTSNLIFLGFKLPSEICPSAELTEFQIKGDHQQSPLSWNSSQLITWTDNCNCVCFNSVVYWRLKYSAEAKVFQYLAFSFGHRSFNLNGMKKSIENSQTWFLFEGMNFSKCNYSVFSLFLVW